MGRGTRYRETIQQNQESHKLFTWRCSNPHIQHQKHLVSCSTTETSQKLVRWQSILLPSLLFRRPLFWKTQAPCSKDSCYLLCPRLSCTRGQSGPNCLCTRKDFVSCLMHWEQCQINGQCHISLGKCSLEFLSASFYTYDFSKCNCDTCILLLHHTSLLPSEANGAQMLPWKYVWQSLCEKYQVNAQLLIYKC